jgi:hypothetical protein
MCILSVRMPHNADIFLEESDGGSGEEKPACKSNYILGKRNNNKEV